MNYRHAYHAGNFADVVKHIVLCRVLVHLLAKPAAFRMIDTHAGAGLYDLTAAEAAKTGEWREGIGKVIDAKFDDDVSAVLAPYLDAVAAANPPGKLVKIVAVARSDEHVFNLEGGCGTKSGQPARGASGYALNSEGQVHSALIGTETLSLVVYRGEPDQNISFEVVDATPPSKVL